MVSLGKGYRPVEQVLRARAVADVDPPLERRANAVVSCGTVPTERSRR
jgi:hypothetical protein